jgi:hypothetical protein
MTRISYEKAKRIACSPAGRGAEEVVYLGGRRVGTIYRDGTGFYYQPNTGFYYQPKATQLRGETFATLAEVHASLEGR